jgi:hypothetical protein
MVKEIIGHIGKRLHEQNSVFDDWAAGAIVYDGKVVIDHPIEKENVGISDVRGISFYIRHNGNYQYSTGRKQTSDTHYNDITVPLRLVAFGIKRVNNIDPVKAERVLANQLLHIDFQNIEGLNSPVEVQLQSSCVESRRVLTEEISTESRNPGDRFRGVCIDFYIKFQRPEKEQCLDNNLILK